MSNEKKVWIAYVPREIELMENDDRIATEQNSSKYIKLLSSICPFWRW
jgi:hypothetical protein